MTVAMPLSGTICHP